MKRSGKSRPLAYALAVAAGSLLAVNLLAVKSADASEPSNQLSTDSGALSDAVVRIGGTNGLGTGSVIGDMMGNVGGVGPTIDLCIVTCNHVAGNGVNYVGFGTVGSVVDGTTVASFNAMPTASARQQLFSATGGAEDLEWVGVQIPVSSLTAAQAQLLENLTPLTIAQAPAQGAGNTFTRNPPNASTTNQANLAAANQFTFTEFGYGVSGSTTILGALTTAYPRANFMYATNLAGGGVSSYGTERYFGDTINAFSRYKGDGYNYYAESWVMTNGQQGNSGDSGAPLIDTTSGSSAFGAIQGVLTNVWGDSSGNLYSAGGYEGFTTSSQGLGDAFTARDVATINADDAAYCTPEPKEVVALLGLAGGALIFWVKPRRKLPPRGDTPAV